MILRMPRQLSCCGMCKIVTWSKRQFLYERNMYFFFIRFGLWARKLFVKWVPDSMRHGSHAACGTWALNGRSSLYRVTSAMWSRGAFRWRLFFIKIQITGEDCFAVSQMLIRWLLPNFAYGMTAVLSWHVQKFVAMCLPGMDSQQTSNSLNLNYDGKKSFEK